MSLDPLLNNATPEELVILARIAERANAKPAILVTVDKRRYVVDQADEPLFNEAPNGPTPADRLDRMEHLGGNFAFGCQWMRSFGKVDECYRTLSAWEITKVERVDRRRVWGR